MKCTTSFFMSALVLVILAGILFVAFKYTEITAVIFLILGGLLVWGSLWKICHIIMWED